MSKFLDAFVARTKTMENHMMRVAVIHGDGDPELAELRPASPLQPCYSVSKAFTLTGVGFLVDEGKLDVTETVPAVLGHLCPKTYDPRWDTTTVQQLMQHQVGLTCSMDVDSDDPAKFGEDYLHFAMNMPLHEDHGTVQHFTDAAIYMLSCCVEARAGMPLDSYLWRKLFRPLGFRDAAWSHCPKGHALGGTGLYLRTEDMVKLGVVYMNGGLWKGQRILSEAWISQVFSHKYDMRPMGIGNCYGKHGMRGQTLFVVPDLKRVVAWQGSSDLNYDKLGLGHLCAQFQE